jgi:hypothetical protein
LDITLLESAEILRLTPEMDAEGVFLWLAVALWATSA